MSNQTHVSKKFKKEDIVKVTSTYYCDLDIPVPKFFDTSDVSIYNTLGMICLDSYKDIHDEIKRDFFSNFCEPVYGVLMQTGKILFFLESELERIT